MESKVLVITDCNRNIEFTSILNFYSVDILQLDKLDFIRKFDYQVAIVDIKDISQAVSKSNTIRLATPWIPLLVIVDSKTSLKAECNYLSSVNGSGPIKTLRWKKNYPADILNNIQNLINPTYTVNNSSIAIVLPVFNEEARFNHIYNFINKLKIMLQKGFTNINMIFLNDGSTDNTQELIDKILEHDLKNENCIYDEEIISYNKLKYNTRKAGTYIEAINSIHANIIVFVDADDSFEVDDISLMINILKLGYYDMIIGTKDFTSTKRSVKRKILSFFKRLITKPFLPRGIIDSQTGLKAMSWNSAQYIFPYLHEKMELAIDLQILYISKKLNFRVLQIPVKCTDREGSHVDVFKDSIKFMKNLFNLMR